MLHEIIEKAKWDEIISRAEVASGKFLQSWEWGEFQKALGRKVFRFSDGTSAALIVELPMPLGKKYWMCPKGPVGPIHDSRFTIHDFVEELKKEAKNAGAVFLRIEPVSEPVFDEAQTDRVKGDKNVMLSVSKHGICRAPHDVNPAMTTIADLTKSEEELLAAMHPKTRYNIRVAERHGVEISRHADAKPVFDEMMALFAETAKRDGFSLHPADYYRVQLDAMDEKKTYVPGVHTPHPVVFVARHGGKMLAAAVVMFAGDAATYLHGASSNEARNVMAPYALHWAIIRRAKERGYKSYDLWGISDDPKSSWAGITRFKRGWGGNEYSAPGTYDLPLSRFWYNVYRLARRMKG